MDATSTALLSSAGAAALAGKAYPRHAGKGAIWSDDPHIELPIHVPPGQLRDDAADPAAWPPTTLHDAFASTVRAHASMPALRVKRGGRWIEWTYAQYYDACKLFGRACLHPTVRLDATAAVAVMAFNSPEWVIAAVGTIFAGGLHVGVYTTATPAAAEYVLANAGTQIAVCDDAAQLDKALRARRGAAGAALLAIVLTQGDKPTTVAAEAGIYTWSEFLALGEQVAEAALMRRIAATRPGHAACAIYTSGTTANPKGVLLSHDNLVWTAKTTQRDVNAVPGEVIISYLPMSHIAAALTDIHGSIVVGITVAFAQPDALKGSLIETLREVRPHLFLGVPRVWEKIEENLRAVGAAGSSTRRAIATYAKAVGAAGSAARLAGRPDPWGYALADAVVFANIRRALGLDRCRVFASGAAPLPLGTALYFASLGIIIREAYGLSECTGPHTTNKIGPDGTRFGTVGSALSGVETRLHDVDPATGDGEVCMRGRHVFMGYLRDPAATAAAIDAEGWLHTGDRGRLEPSSIAGAPPFLRITGRLKEIIITAGGENVAPVPVEEAVRTACPAIANVMLVGDRRKFISALVTLKTEVDGDGAPTDALAPAALAVAASVGSSAKTATEAERCARLATAIEAAVAAANAAGASRASKVQKWALVTPDFSVAGGELTPTLKLKRHAVAARHAKTIERIYRDAEPIAASPAAARPRL